MQCYEGRPPPCDRMTTCQNRSPGYLCTGCPDGYSGDRVEGVGLDYAHEHRQVRSIVEWEEPARLDGRCEFIAVYYIKDLDLSASY